MVGTREEDECGGLWAGTRDVIDRKDTLSLL